MQPNAIAFIALCNEFCSTLEHVASGADPVTAAKPDFVASMLNYIPRLYISATDLKTLPSPSSPFDSGDGLYDDGYDEALEEADERGWAIDDILSEDYYESIRRAIEGIMGEDDIYLEVFEEDMKYSDTPISASVAEGLADIFQSLYNFIETVRDAPAERVTAAMAAAKEDFEHFWSRPACNILRALNNIRYFSLAVDD